MSNNIINITDKIKQKKTSQELSSDQQTEEARLIRIKQTLDRIYNLMQALKK